MLRGIYAYGQSRLQTWQSTAETSRIRLRLPPVAGFEKPSAIQQRAILPVIKGRDVIAQVRTTLSRRVKIACAETRLPLLPQAQSGTGKTATFSISMLQSIDSSVRDTQALVLSPTRELATQIQSVVLALGGASLLLAASLSLVQD